VTETLLRSSRCFTGATALSVLGPNCSGQRYVFVADQTDQLGIEHGALIDRDSPGLRKRLLIVNRHLDFQTAEVRTPEPFGDFCRIGEGRGRNHEQARSGLKDLAAKHVALNKLIDAQLARRS
jgi:hypothetical protein